MFWPLTAHIKEHYLQEVTNIQCDVKQSNYALINIKYCCKICTDNYWACAHKILTGKPLIKHTQGLPSLHNSCVPTGSHVAWHRLYSIGFIAFILTERCVVQLALVPCIIPLCNFIFFWQLYCIVLYCILCWEKKKRNNMNSGRCEIR